MKRTPRAGLRASEATSDAQHSSDGIVRDFVIALQRAVAEESRLRATLERLAKLLSDALAEGEGRAPVPRRAPRIRPAPPARSELGLDSFAQEAELAARDADLESEPAEADAAVGGYATGEELVIEEELPPTEAVVETDVPTVDLTSQSALDLDTDG